MSDPMFTGESLIGRSKGEVGEREGVVLEPNKFVMDEIGSNDFIGGQEGGER